ncbi:putative transcription factor NAM family [Rosa chinensis]|uniref:Putative transcription factor NAM family n=1 Tax=Rosa chinensis TaxID=74649 RepID=A0A2P6Q0J3_ROSCH|nr:putative transcription factor NAM family [Rosa chinensis]
MADSKSTDAFPPGFRFHPSEQQLLSYYLSNKKANPAIPGGYNTIRELSDLRGRDPSELQNWSCYSYGYKGRKRHWYFYTAGVSAEEKNTKQGCWKRKGKVRDVFSRQGVVLGTRTSFVYYDGSPDTASPTAWVLYQYALANHVEVIIFTCACSFALVSMYICCPFSYWILGRLLA